MKKTSALFLLPALILTSCGHQHTYSSEWTAIGEEGHAHMATCEHKDLHTEIEPHEFEKTVVPATESSIGYDHYECKVCGYFYNNNTTAKSSSVEYELSPSLRKEDSTKVGGYDITINFNESYFSGSAKVFNKDLALLSNSISMMAESEATISRFYSTLMFDHFESHYVATPTRDTLSYAFAHRVIDGYDLISVVVNGHNYGLEWANNALVGLSGDHEGFSLRTNEVYAALQNYLKGYYKYKLWISGYSRGGAISNMLSHYILSRNEIKVSQENLFTYTFECPKGLDKNNAPKYENVFNVLYSGDLVTYVAPEEFGFARCGVDIDLYVSSESTDSVLKAFDEDIDIPAFEPCTDYNDSDITDETEQAAIQSLLAYITREGEDSENQIYVHTREDYVNKVQSAVQTAVSIFFGLPSDIKDRMIAAAKDNAMSLLSSAQAIYDFLVPYLNEAGYEYEPDALLADCNALFGFVMNNVMILMAVYFNNANGKDIIRSIKVHYPEVGYALLASYTPAE